MENKRKQRFFIQLALISILALCGTVLTYVVGVLYDTEPLPMDYAIQGFFFDLRSSGFNVLIKAITHLGDPLVIVLLCAGLLLLPFRLRVGLPVSLSALAGLFIYKPMKQIFLR